MTRIQRKDWVPFLVAVGVSELVGIAGSAFTASAVPTWYVSLAKPAFSPPSWVFAPVWTVLYFLMGVSAALVWRSPSPERRAALALFGIQLALNALWSAVFFGLRAPFAALIEIALLWTAILATTVSFARVSRAASLLLLPYLVWVSFAAYLNFALWKLNP